jgi:protocatechuate 3,4-dioxygenase beta subunit
MKIVLDFLPKVGLTFAVVLFNLFSTGMCRAQSVAPSKTAKVEGKVLNGLTGEPVPRAQVTLTGLSGKDFSATAGKGGYFALNGIDPGSYRMRAGHDGFVDAANVAPGSKEGDGVITLAKSQTLRNIVVKLMPLGVILGRVFSEQGEPLANAVTIASLSPATGGDGMAAFVGRVYTNDLGEYRLYGLPPGRYTVRASYQSGRNFYRTTYYPAAFNLVEAATLEVLPGTVLTGVDVTLARRDEGPRSPKTSDAPTGERGAVEGKVVSLSSGDPVGRALVAAEGSGATASIRQTTISDASGRFTLEEIPAGSYRLSASRSGFVAGDPASTRSDAVLVVAGQVTRDAAVGLVPQGVIAGRVLGEDQEPLSNAVVMAVSSSSHAGKRELDMVKRVYTDDLGQYRLHGLRAGSYYIHAVYRGERGSAAGTATRVAATAADSGGEESYLPTYYPNALSVREAIALKVAAGGMISGVDLTLRRSRQVHVGGRLLISGSRPVQNLTVALLHRDPYRISRFIPQLTAAVKKTNGEFQIPQVPPGSYVMAADWVNGAKQCSARQAIEVGTTDIDGVVLTPICSLQVNGEIRAEVPDTLDLSSLGVFLRSDESGALAHGARTTVKADGSFSVENVLPEHYRVEVSGLRDDYYLKTVYVGNQEVASSDVDLSLNRTLRLVVSADGGKIQGMVLDDKQQAAGAVTVALFPEPQERAPNFYKTATTGRDGKFVLRGIPPGDYKVVASERVDLDSFRASDRFEKVATAISVEKNSSVILNLVLVRDGW